MTWFLTSKLGRALAIAGAALLAIVTFGASKKREGRREAETDALEDSAKRQEDGRNAVAEEQAQTDGLSKRDIIDRMRGRISD